MEISSLLFAVLCCLLPYCAIMAIVAIIGTRTKYRSAFRILERIEQDQPKPLDRARLGGFTKIMIIIACFLLIPLLIISLVLVAVFYFSPNSLLKVNADILWIIIPIFIVAGALTSGIFIVMFRRILSKQ